VLKRIIRFSAENKFLVIAGALVAIVRPSGHAEHSARCAARSLGHAGHRLLALGSQPGHHRGPGHLSHHHGALGAPKVKAIRGYSDFGFSYVYVIFEDGTDIYWARTRVSNTCRRSRRSFPRA
jgi:Cu(I)/Ag(I) efflux system membrane protein CusA/SilA